MALPTFKQMGARRRQQKEDIPPADGGVVQDTPSPAGDSEKAFPSKSYNGTGVNIIRATRKRKTWIIISSLFFFISVIFLILTIIGNINKRAVIRDTYFFSLDLSNIIPSSTPAELTLVNSLARSLGLHDFYHVGLWNFCEGYNNEGITDCSSPRPLYWFNPVSILLNELLAGATIALPANINDILNLIKIASHLMFGFFLTGICMNFVSIFLTPITLYSRWWELPFVIWTFIAALLTTAAAIIATVMFVIFRNVITSQTNLNIGASLGTQMFAFMWVGAAFSIFGWLIHLCLSCCCASRRDVRTGRRKGDKGAYANEEKKVQSGRKRRFPFARKKTSGEVV